MFFHKNKKKMGKEDWHILHLMCFRNAMTPFLKQLNIK